MPVHADSGNVRSGQPVGNAYLSLDAGQSVGRPAHPDHDHCAGQPEDGVLADAEEFCAIPGEPGLPTGLAQDEERR
jgi:hypothetical protein